MFTANNHLELYKTKTYIFSSPTRYLGKTIVGFKIRPTKVKSTQPSGVDKWPRVQTKTEATPVPLNTRGVTLRSSGKVFINTLDRYQVHMFLVGWSWLIIHWPGNYLVLPVCLHPSGATEAEVRVSINQNCLAHTIAALHLKWSQTTSFA